MMFTFQLPASFSQPEGAVREALQTNSAELVAEVTGGCCTVDVREIAMDGAHAGHAIVWIGGVARLTERLPFEIDWGTRVVKFTAPAQ